METVTVTPELVTTVLLLSVIFKVNVVVAVGYTVSVSTEAAVANVIGDPTATPPANHCAVYGGQPPVMLEVPISLVPNPLQVVEALAVGVATESDTVCIVTSAVAVAEHPVTAFVAATGKV